MDMNKSTCQAGNSHKRSLSFNNHGTLTPTTLSIPTTTTSESNNSNNGGNSRKKKLPRSTQNYCYNDNDEPSPFVVSPLSPHAHPSTTSIPKIKLNTPTSRRYSSYSSSSSLSPGSKSSSFAIPGTTSGPGTVPAANASRTAVDRRLSNEEIFDVMEKEQESIVLRLMKEISTLKDENRTLRQQLTLNNNNSTSRTSSITPVTSPRENDHNHHYFHAAGSNSSSQIADDLFFLRNYNRTSVSGSSGSAIIE